jgi:tetratricopeptide (TPR) repeat protein
MIRSQKKLRQVEAPLERLSSEESLIVGSQSLLSWVQENSRKVFIGAGAVVVLVAAFFLWRANKAVDEEKASVMLSRITPTYQGSDWRKAVDGDMNRRVQGEPVRGLKEIVGQYGSTTAGNMAKVYLGNCYYYLGKLDSAREVFESVSAAQPLVKASVDAGKAAIFEEKGNKEEAAKLFVSAAMADETNPLNADYNYAAARNYEQAGKKDDAVKIYRKVIAEYPGGFFDDAAKRALIRLQVEL